MSAIPPLRKILYVEDEEVLQTITRMALTRLGGFEVETCSEGQLAVGHARAFSPDLILLDVMMPGMDGPTTFAALQADGAARHIPVIFITAKVQPQEVERYLALGVTDVIAKPFDPMSLSGRLREIWERCHGTGG
ncbi:MAG TPA: response regulator [Azospirillaceae bacterium]|nr:response regulator [Azospirillaceae bacterium]